MQSLIVFFVLILLAKIVFAQVEGEVYQWELKRDKDGIQIYTSEVKGSKFKAVRAEMLMDASLHSLVSLLHDRTACPKWAHLCKEEKTIERVSPTESYVYSYNDIPFPVKDRDVLAHVVWQYDADKKKASMRSAATPSRLEKTKAVRIEKAIAYWHFTEKGEGKVHIQSFAHVDPNGPTPAWVTNMLLVDSPFKTMKGMRKIIQSGQYDEKKVSFLP